MSPSFPGYSDDEVEQLLLFPKPKWAQLFEEVHGMAFKASLDQYSKNLFFSSSIDPGFTIAIVNDSHIPPSQIKP